MRTQPKKLVLAKETVHLLDPKSLVQVAARAQADSVLVCRPDTWYQCSTSCG